MWNFNTISRRSSKKSQSPLDTTQKIFFSLSCSYAIRSADGEKYSLPRIDIFFFTKNRDSDIIPRTPEKKYVFMAPAREKRKKEKGRRKMQRNLYADIIKTRGKTFCMQSSSITFFFGAQTLRHEYKQVHLLLELVRHHSRGSLSPFPSNPRNKRGEKICSFITRARNLYPGGKRPLCGIGTYGAVRIGL